MGNLMPKGKTETIRIIFSFESQTTKAYDSELNVKQKDIFKQFASDNSLPLHTIFFLYNGTAIDKNSEDAIYNLASQEDKKRKKIMILVYKAREDEDIISLMSNLNNEAKIIFSFEAKKIVKIPCNKNEKMKDICIRFAHKIGADFNSLLFAYSGKPFSYDITFNI